MQGAGKSLRAGTWCAVLLACMIGAAVCPAAEVLAGSPEAPAGQRAPATAPPSGTAAAPAESPTPVEPATDPATKVATPGEAALELTPEAIEARIKVIENKTALSEEDKKKILERLTQAQAELQRADTHAAQAAQFAKTSEGAPAEVERIRTQLAEAAPAPEAAIPAEGSAADLEAELKKLETELAAQHKAVEDLEASLKGRPERKAALPDLITTARKRLAEVEKELAAPAAPAASVAAEAQQTLLRARRRAVEAEIKTLEAELNTFPALTSLLTARSGRRRRPSARPPSSIRSSRNWRPRTPSWQPAAPAPTPCSPRPRPPAANSSASRTAPSASCRTSPRSRPISAWPA
jgi:hypothetical protein